MKLLVVNLQNPGETKYHDPKKIGSWMLARRLSNYRMFTLNDNCGLVPIVINDGADVMEIQRIVDEVFSHIK
ncbi:MAG: hypothetical protein KAS32_24190 [Candidatus Peribacteraceae bacterium]|nr:hypothetical protein [Candidatus Peribacteraceae bacterium]